MGKKKLPSEADLARQRPLNRAAAAAVAQASPSAVTLATPTIVGAMAFALLSYFLFPYLSSLSSASSSLSLPGSSVWADNSAVLPRKFLSVPCAEDSSSSIPGCSPQKGRCGRVVKDGLFSNATIATLRDMAERVMAFGGGGGGATIFDPHKGVLSKGAHFVDFFRYLEGGGHSAKEVVSKSELEMLSQVAATVGDQVKAEFGASQVFLTSPTFFSRMDGGVKPVTEHDEYWHTHIDKIAYPTFVYTGLLYLSNYEEDFSGGAFVFEGPREGEEARVLPNAGRLLLFTSGAENPHRVERVMTGRRYAMTIAFTCSKSEGLEGKFLDRWE